MWKDRLMRYSMGSLIFVYFFLLLKSEFEFLGHFLDFFLISYPSMYYENWTLKPLNNEFVVVFTIDFQN